MNVKRGLKKASRPKEAGKEVFRNILRAGKRGEKREMRTFWWGSCTRENKERKVTGSRGVVRFVLRRRKNGTRQDSYIRRGGKENRNKQTRRKGKKIG